MADNKSHKTKKSEQTQITLKWIIENVISFALAFLLVFMVRSSILEAFKIPSGSMIPTLLVGDHIFVNKFAYGLKIPFSDNITDHPIYLIKRPPPKHGDVIVFKYPKDESLYYIKRVIGIPGDTVEIRNKSLFINQKLMNKDLLEMPTEKITANLDDHKYDPTSLNIFHERLDQAEHLIMLDKKNSYTENFGPIEVPADQLFVMGDNRDFSNDSRFWGFVPMNNVKGKAVVIWWSIAVDFSEPHLTFRPKRIGTLIQ
jgi:signal peptidase I